MFDHLDDPQPFEPGEELHRAVTRRGRSLRRRRRLLATSATAVVVALGVLAATAAVVDHELDSVDTVDVPSLRTTAAPGDPKVILFVGTDGPNASGERTPPFRTDTMILARVDPGHETLAILPIPRDLLVDIPGQGRGRLNGAYAKGGPALLVETIDQSLGIEVDHYVETDFAGAVSIGDAIGGLALSFPGEVRDRSTGFTAPAGCTRLDGSQLLALSRSRRFQVRAGGAWRQDPTSDLGRIERQQAVGAALLRRFAELDASDPGEVLRLTRSVSDHLVVDAETSTADLVGLFRAVSGSRPVPLRLPASDTVYGGAAVLELGPSSPQVVARFLGQPEDREPEEPTASTTSTTTVPLAPAVPTPADAIPTPC